MTIQDDVKTLQTFVDLWQKAVPESTGANVIYYMGTVYNVEGSTQDPHIGRLTWKQLLILYGINGNCYVDPSAAPGDSSHPGFDVGGHMTPNSTGYVPPGGECLLMPLCAWHNNPARDRQAFQHVETKMLKLTGYYQGELAITFVARLPSDQPYSVIYADAEGWQTKNLSAELGKQVVAGNWPEDELGVTPTHYILLERMRSRSITTHAIRAVRL